MLKILVIRHELPIRIDPKVGGNSLVGFDELDVSNLVGCPKNFPLMAIWLVPRRGSKHGQPGYRENGR